jgi:hypothetical protein
VTTALLAIFIVSGVMVCVITVPAFHTPKLRLGFPVGFVDIPASWALSASMAWIDSYHRHASMLDLIRDKGAKLAEAPVMRAFPLRFVGLNPCPDMREVFKRNAKRGAFRNGNDAFRHTVVFMCLEPLLSAANLVKTALSRPCAHALQGGAPFGVAFPIRLYFGARMLITQAISGDIDHTEIHTQHAFGHKQFRIIKVAHGSQIPFAAHAHQIHFAFSVFKQSALVIAAHIANLLSTRQKLQRDFLIRDKPQDTVIVRLRGMLAEGASDFLIPFISVRHFSDAAHRHLGGQLKLSAKFWVGKLMQIVLAKRFSLPSAFGEPVACLIATRQRQTQFAFLCGCRRQFEVSHQRHTFKCGILLTRGQEALPLPPEVGSLRAWENL